MSRRRGMAMTAKPAAAGGRQIGPIGTLARVLLGFLMVGLGALGGKVVVINGHLQLEWQVEALPLGLVGFPAVLLAIQWIRSRRTASPLDETGPIATAVNILVFALLAITALVPSISFIGFAAIAFYGSSMLLAAARGYAGCEVLAVSNWLLRRDD